jgi:hypothetical protein
MSSGKATRIKRQPLKQTTPSPTPKPLDPPAASLPPQVWVPAGAGRAAVPLGAPAAARGALLPAGGGRSRHNVPRCITPTNSRTQTHPKHTQINHLHPSHPPHPHPQKVLAIYPDRSWQFISEHIADITTKQATEFGDPAGAMAQARELVEASGRRAAPAQQHYLAQFLDAVKRLQQQQVGCYIRCLLCSCCVTLPPWFWGVWFSFVSQTERPPPRNAC